MHMLLPTIDSEVIMSTNPVAYNPALLSHLEAYFANKIPFQELQWRLEQILDRFIPALGYEMAKTYADQFNTHTYHLPEDQVHRGNMTVYNNRSGFVAVDKNNTRPGLVCYSIKQGIYRLNYRNDQFTPY